MTFADLLGVLLQFGCLGFELCQVRGECVIVATHLVLRDDECDIINIVGSMVG